MGATSTSSLPDRQLGERTSRGSDRVWLPGTSDDDPSGIATYAQTGAQFGFAMLWAALITFPLMAGVQEICDRTALRPERGSASSWW